MKLLLASVLLCAQVAFSQYKEISYTLPENSKCASIRANMKLSGPSIYSSAKHWEVHRLNSGYLIRNFDKLEFFDLDMNSKYSFTLPKSFLTANGKIGFESYYFEGSDEQILCIYGTGAKIQFFKASNKGVILEKSWSGTELPKIKKRGILSSYLSGNNIKVIMYNASFGAKKHALVTINTSSGSLKHKELILPEKNKDEVGEIGWGIFGQNDSKVLLRQSKIFKNKVFINTIELDKETDKVSGFFSYPLINTKYQKVGISRPLLKYDVFSNSLYIFGQFSNIEKNIQAATFHGVFISKYDFSTKKLLYNSWYDGHDLAKIGGLSYDEFGKGMFSDKSKHTDLKIEEDNNVAVIGLYTKAKGQRQYWEAQVYFDLEKGPEVAKLEQNLMQNYRVHTANYGSDYESNLSLTPYENKVLKENKSISSFNNKIDSFASESSGKDLIWYTVDSPTGKKDLFSLNQKSCETKAYLTE